MNKWARAPLSDLTDSSAGGTPSRAIPEYYGGDIPWVKSTEVNKDQVWETSEFLSKSGLKYSNCKLAGIDSVLIAMYGATAGQISKLKIEAATNQAVLAISCFESLDSDFLYYVLTNNKERILYLAQGSGQPNLSKALIDRTVIDYPILSEQQKIANTLTTVDNLIEKTQALIDKYTQIKQGMMADLFTRGIDLSGTPQTNPNHGQLRPSVKDAPELYQQTELGWVPKEWEIYSFGDLADYKNGNSFSADEWKEEGYPIIRIQNLNGSNEYNYYQGQVKESWHVFPGDLLFAWSGQKGVSFGARVWLGLEGVLNQHIFKVYENTKVLSRQFLFYLFKLNVGRIEDNAHGFKDSFVHVTRSELTEVMVKVPLKSEQEVIEERVSSLELNVSLEEGRLEKYKKMKRGLMQDLLTGKVPVN